MREFFYPQTSPFGITMTIAENGTTKLDYLSMQKG